MANYLLHNADFGISAQAQEKGTEAAPKVDILEAMIRNRDALITQRAAAQRERDLQVSGGKRPDGSKVGAGRGIDYTKSADEIARIDALLSEVNPQIKKEQMQRDPQYKAQIDKLNTAEAGLTEDLKKAPKSFYKENPNAAKWWNLAPIALSGATAGLWSLADVLGSRIGARQWRKALDSGLAPGATLETQRVANDISRRMADKSKFSPNRSETGKYVTMGTVGGLEGMGVANFPAWYDSGLPASNPERDAYIQYLKRLPAGEVGDEERKKKAGALVGPGGLPVKNPDREGAMDYFGSPLSVLMRTGLAGLEGGRHSDGRDEGRRRGWPKRGGR